MKIKVIECDDCENDISIQEDDHVIFTVFPVTNAEKTVEVALHNDCLSDMKATALIALLDMEKGEKSYVMESVIHS